MSDQTLLIESDSGARQNLGEATQLDPATIGARVVDMDVRYVLTGIKALLEVTGIKLDAPDSDLASQTTLATISSRFARLLKFEPAASEGLRREETATDDYHGASADGTQETSPGWDIVRFYKDAGGNIPRVRFRAGVAWADRASGWA